MEYWDDYAEYHIEEDTGTADDEDTDSDDDYDYANEDDTADNIEISAPTITTMIQDGEVMFKCDTDTKLTRKTR